MGDGEMAAERVKWWGGLAGGVAAGVVVTALWMDARAWRGDMERRIDALENEAAAGASAPVAALLEAAKANALGVAKGGAGAAQALGCTGAAPAQASNAPGGRRAGAMSAEEWLAAEDARS